MQLQKRVQAWVDAQIIDEAQAQKIVTYELQTPRASWITFGIVAIGVIAIATGIISIVAANWHEIPPYLRLLGYFISSGALAYSCHRFRNAHPVAREGLLLGFMLYILAGIGLIGQTYHLTSDGYSALFLWVALALPVTICTERRLASHLWCLGLCVALCSWVSASNSNDWRRTILVAAPFFMIYSSYLLDHVRVLPLWSTVRLWSYAILICGNTVAGNVLLAHDDSGYLSSNPEEIVGHRAIIIGGATTALVGVWIRCTTPGLLVSLGKTMTLTVAGLFSLIAAQLYAPAGMYPVLGCVLFMIAWIGMGIVAAAANYKHLYDLVTLVIGVRLIVVYIEVFGSLAATGAGLVVTGVLILSILFCWNSYRTKISSYLSTRL